MILIALDPGHSTGIAIFNRGTLSYSSTVQWTELEGVLRLLKTNFFPCKVVRERMPNSSVNPHHILTMRAIEICDRYFPPNRQIGPGTWKPYSEKNFVFPAGFDRPTVHQIDAYRLGMYYMTFYPQEVQ